MLHFCYVASSSFKVSSDHIPIGRSFHFSLTFKVINLNAVEYSCSQLVQSDALKLVRSIDGINFFAWLHKLVLLTFSYILCFQKLAALHFETVLPNYIVLTMLAPPFIAFRLYFLPICGIFPTWS